MGGKDDVRRLLLEPSGAGWGRGPTAEPRLPCPRGEGCSLACRGHGMCCRRQRGAFPPAGAEHHVRRLKAVVGCQMVEGGTAKPPWPGGGCGWLSQKSPRDSIHPGCVALWVIGNKPWGGGGEDRNEGIGAASIVVPACVREVLQRSHRPAEPRRPED